MRNLYNLGLSLIACCTMTACHTDEIPEATLGEGATLELESVTLEGETLTKGVTTSVNEVKLYLQNSSSTWVNPLFTKSGVTWGCKSAPTLGSETDVYAYHPTAEAGGTAIEVETASSSSDAYLVPVTIKSEDAFDGEQIDYLYADPVTASSSSKVISLKLKHALAKVSFQVYKSTSASDEVLNLTKIEIRSNTGRLQVGTGSMRINGAPAERGGLTGIPSSSLITLIGSRTLETSISQPNVSCLVAPMSAPEQVLSFRLTVNVDGVDREFETASISSSTNTPVEWKAGLHYIYKIRIDKMEGTFEGVSVYDWQNSTDQNTSVGI